MPAKGQYKKNASKETIRQRKKNQKPVHKKKRVESNAARKKKGLKPLKGNTGNPAKRSEADHKQGKMVSHKTNRSQDNNKNHKRKK
jgi:hypothetical protein